MTYHAFLKVGWRCDGIILYHELKISSQPIAGRIEVGISKWSSCRKLQAWWFSRHKNGGETPVSRNGQCNMQCHRWTICFIIEAFRYSGFLSKAMWYNHNVYAGCRHKLPAVWTNSSAAISSTTESSGEKFLLLGLLGLPTWILATFRNGDASRPCLPWS